MTKYMKKKQKKPETRKKKKNKTCLKYKKMHMPTYGFLE